MSQIFPPQISWPGFLPPNVRWNRRKKGRKNIYGKVEAKREREKEEKSHGPSFLLFSMVSFCGWLPGKRGTGPKKSPIIRQDLDSWGRSKWNKHHCIHGSLRQPFFLGGGARVTVSSRKDKCPLTPLIDSREKRVPIKALKKKDPFSITSARSLVTYLNKPARVGRKDKKKGRMLSKRSK